MAQLITHVDFYKEMNVPSISLSNFLFTSSNTTGWRDEVEKFGSRSVALSSVKRWLQQWPNLCELVYRDKTFSEETRLITTHKIYEMKVLLSSWDGAWVRKASPTDQYAFIQNALVLLPRMIRLQSGWRVLAVCWITNGALDEIHLMLTPCIPKVSPRETRYPAVGRRPTIVNGTCARLPTRSACVAVSALTIAISRLRQFAFHLELARQDLQTAKADVRSCKKLIAKQSFSAMHITAWLNRIMWPKNETLIRRVGPPVPLTLLVPLCLDTICHRERKRIMNVEDCNSFLNQVRNVRNSYGENILLDEMPIKQFYTPSTVEL